MLVSVFLYESYALGDAQRHYYIGTGQGRREEKLHELGELPAVNLTRDAGTGPTYSPAPGRPGTGAGGKRRRSKASNTCVCETPPPKGIEGTVEQRAGNETEA